MPDWKDAPEWAQWLERDGYMRWFWYEEKPNTNKSRPQQGRYQYAKTEKCKTLHQRPTT